MKTLLLILLLPVMLVSCVDNPSVSITNPDGTKVVLTTGRNHGAEVDEQVSEVEGGGYHLRHMVKRQDATRVYLGLVKAATTLGTLGIAYLQQLEAEVTTRVVNGEITKREGQVILGDIKKAEIAADVTKHTTENTVLNPNITH